MADLSQRQQGNRDAPANSDPEITGLTLELETTLDNLNTSINSVEFVKVESDLDKTEVTDYLSMILEECRGVSAALNQCSKAITTQRQEANALSRQAQQTYNQAQAALLATASNEDRLEKILDGIVAIQTAIENGQVTIGEVKTGQAIIVAEQAALKNGQNATMTAVKNIHETITAEQAEIKRVQKVIKDGQEVLEKGQSDIKSGQTEIRNCHTALETSQTEIRNGYTALETSQNEIKKGQVTLEKSHTEIKDTISKLQKSQSDIEADHAEIKREQLAIKDGQTVIKDGQAALEQGHLEIKGALTEVKAGQTKISSGQAGLPDLKAIKNSLPDLQAIETSLSELKEEQTAVKTALETVENGQVLLEQGQTKILNEQSSLKNGQAAIRAGQEAMEKEHAGIKGVNADLQQSANDSKKVLDNHTDMLRRLTSSSSTLVANPSSSRTPKANSTDDGRSSAITGRQTRQSAQSQSITGGTTQTPSSGRRQASSGSTSQPSSVTRRQPPRRKEVEAALSPRKRPSTQKRVKSNDATRIPSSEGDEEPMEMQEGDEEEIEVVGSSFPSGPTRSFETPLPRSKIPQTPKTPSSSTRVPSMDEFIEDCDAFNPFAPNRRSPANELPDEILAAIKPQLEYFLQPVPYRAAIAPKTTNRVACARRKAKASGGSFFATEMSDCSTCIAGGQVCVRRTPSNQRPLLMPVRRSGLSTREAWGDPANWVGS